MYPGRELRGKPNFLGSPDAEWERGGELGEVIAAGSSFGWTCREMPGQRRDMDLRCWCMCPSCGQPRFGFEREMDIQVLPSGREAYHHAGSRYVPFSR